MVEPDPDLGEYFLFASHLDSLPVSFPGSGWVGAQGKVMNKSILIDTQRYKYRHSQQTQAETDS